MGSAFSSVSVIVHSCMDSTDHFAPTVDLSAIMPEILGGH
jgi:hypothetical protein